MRLRLPLPHKQRWQLLCLLITLIALPVGLGIAQGVTPEQVKASYLLQLRKFVWVGKPAKRVETICYYEKPGIPAGESAGQVLKEYLEKSPVPGLNVKWFQGVSNFSDCDIFYIPDSEEDNIDNILTKLGSAPILTVSGAKRFIFRGGMIGFVLDDANHIKMEGNLRNMRAKNVDIDTQVLELMQQVIGK